MLSVREMKAVQELSENLRGILDFELARENSIVSVDAPAGTRCPLTAISSEFGYHVSPHISYYSWSPMISCSIRRLFVLMFSVWLAQGVAFAQVVSVPFNERGFLFNTAPTLTFLWPAQKPRVTFIFIPGGEGRIGLLPDRKTLGGFYGATLKPLSDASLTSGSFNVVVFDSPVNLPVGTN